MAEERQQEKENKAAEPAKAARAAQREVAQEVADEAPKFPRERLIADGPLLVGYPSADVAGALHGIAKQNLTVEETKAAVKAWLRAPVKED